MALGWVTPVDYLEFDADPTSNASMSSGETSRPNLGMRQNKPYLKALGQTANTVAGNVANQPIGTLAVPAISVGVLGTIALSNTLITANSMIFVSCRRVGTDSSTSRGPTVFVDAQSTGSATIGVRAQGVAIAVNIYVVHYLIIN